MAKMLPNTPFLRWALLGDAVASGATGLLMTAGGGMLAPVLDLPESLLRGAGLALLPYAGFVGWLGSRAVIRRAALWAVIVINLLWAADSAILLLSGLVAPGGMGVAFVLVQAAVVLSFAVAQAVAARPAPAPACA